MDYPWLYDETIQVGTDYGDRQEVAEYDQRMQKLRDVRAEAGEIQKALALSLQFALSVSIPGERRHGNRPVGITLMQDPPGLSCAHRNEQRQKVLRRRMVP